MTRKFQKMIKKETYITCLDGNIYEGMTSISAIINKCEECGDCQKINKILIDNKKLNSKSRELDFLKRKSAKLGFEICSTSAEEIDALTTGNTHGGIIALCSPTVLPFLSEKSDLIKNNGIFIMLDGIEDPYNFGYSVRSIYASGADGVILSPRNWMNVAGIVAKSSAGASELIDMYISSPEEAIEIFRNKGYKIICSGIRDSVPMYDADMKKPVFLIIGGEKRGISNTITSMADTVARVEYGRDFRGSLSAASAATIMAYEIFRQNRNQ